MSLRDWFFRPKNVNQPSVAEKVVQPAVPEETLKPQQEKPDPSGRFAKLIEDHFTRLRATLSEDRASDWTRSVLQRVLDSDLWRICMLGEGKMAQSISDGERHSASELKDDLFISISTFSCSMEEAKRKYYAEGYLPYLDRMVSMGRQHNPSCHWLHFQFFWDGAHFGVHFTLFPNKQVLEFPPRYSFPLEFLSDDEKKKMRLQ